MRPRLLVGIDATKFWSLSLTILYLMFVFFIDALNSFMLNINRVENKIKSKI